jgi:hypothetical protein
MIRCAAGLAKEAVLGLDENIFDEQRLAFIYDESAHRSDGDRGATNG